VFIFNTNIIIYIIRCILLHYFSLKSGVVDCDTVKYILFTRLWNTNDGENCKLKLK